MCQYQNFCAAPKQIFLPSLAPLRCQLIVSFDNGTVDEGFKLGLVCLSVGFG